MDVLPTNDGLLIITVDASVVDKITDIEQCISEFTTFSQRFRLQYGLIKNERFNPKSPTKTLRYDRIKNNNTCTTDTCSDIDEIINSTDWDIVIIKNQNSNSSSSSSSNPNLSSDSEQNKTL